MATQKFAIHFLWWVILVLTNYAQLLLYISYEKSDLYMLVTTKAFLVAVTRAQVNPNRVLIHSNNTVFNSVQCVMAYSCEFVYKL